MINGNVLIALTGILLGCLHLTEAGECPPYTTCMDNLTSEAMQYAEAVTLLQIDTIPEDLALLCPQEAAVCEPKYHECPETPLLPWQDRFQEAFYARYLLAVGCWIRDHGAGFLALKSCYNQEFKYSWLDCLDKSGYDMQCLRDSYNSDINDCSDEADEAVDAMLLIFEKHPYQRA